MQYLSNHGNRPSRYRKAQRIWDFIRDEKNKHHKRGYFDSRDFAVNLTRPPISTRYVRAYLRALCIANIIECVAPYRPHRHEARYKLTGTYIGSIAPQLAGGANCGGGRLGKAWRT